MRTRRIVALASAFALGAFGVACQFLAGVDDHQFVLLPDAAPEAAVVDVAPAPPARCPVGAQPPPPPGADDEPNVLGVYVVAFRSFDFGLAAATGYDLDGVCTCDPRDNSTHGGGGSCVNPASPNAGCDFDGGVDNALAAGLQRVPALLIVQFETQVNLQLKCGSGTVLLALFDYNGLANDTSVFVATVPSYGLRTPHDAGEIPVAGCTVENTGLFLPKWDGTDIWSVPPGTASSKPRALTTPFQKGYVTNHQLVVDVRGQPDASAFGLPIFGNVSLPLHAGVLVATIVPLERDGGVIEGGATSAPPAIGLADGLVAARARRSDVIQSGAYISTGTPGTSPPFCKSGAAWEAFHTNLCAGPDIMSDPTADFTGQPCDALSSTFGFSAAPAQIGPDFQPDATVDMSCDSALLECP
jgi:hypothetical protein